MNTSYIIFTLTISSLKWNVEGLVNIFHTWLHFNLNSPSNDDEQGKLHHNVASHHLITQPYWFIIHGVEWISFGKVSYMGKCWLVGKGMKSNINWSQAIYLTICCRYIQYTRKATYSACFLQGFFIYYITFLMIDKVLIYEMIITRYTNNVFSTVKLF